MSEKVKEFSQTFFHGCKADLNRGDQVVAGYKSNYLPTYTSKYVYFTSNLSVAAWGAELAAGDGLGRIYVVEPAGPFGDDPNVTDKKFPGNPTKSYRSSEPLLVLGEVTNWQGHTAEEIQARKEGIERMFRNGAQILED